MFQSTDKILIMTYNKFSNYQKHAVNCEWNEWEPYSSCSVTCGEGTKIRKRTKSVEESGDGACTGENEETISCDKDVCINPGISILSTYKRLVLRPGSYV